MFELEKSGYYQGRDLISACIKFFLEGLCQLKISIAIFLHEEVMPLYEILLLNVT